MGRFIALAAACLCALAAAPARKPGGGLPKLPTKSELTLLVPAGFRLAVQLQRDFAQRGFPQYILALADESEDPQKPIELLYVDWDGSWLVRDRVSIRCRDSAEWAESWSPNYVNAMRLVAVGSTTLLYLYTNSWWGGSGSVHIFSFFAIHDGKFELLRQFEHERMMRFYFCLKNNAIYDAVLVKTRGPKHGKAYVYTCYLDVTKYTCDGETIVKVASEKLRETTGNRFLDEKYWNMSVCNALARGEIFQSDQQTKP